MTVQAEGIALPGTAERRRPAPGLIVEMVGPAAAGKSTLAAALVEALRREGCDAVLEASARPAERAGAARPGGIRAAASRAAKIAGLARRGAEGPAAAAMLEALPPASAAWALRYRGYLDALERRWRAAAARPGIAVFDQGFVSAVATLAALGRDFEPAAMARALAAAPAPDLVVRIDAPREALAARLRSRLAGQSFLERLLELDVEACLRQLDAFAALDPLLRGTGMRVVRVEGHASRPDETARALVGQARRLAARSGT